MSGSTEFCWSRSVFWAPAFFDGQLLMISGFMKILSIYYFPWILYTRQVYRRQCLSSEVGVSWYLWLHHKEIRSAAFDALSFLFWTEFALFCDPVQTTELCCCENRRLFEVLSKKLFEDVFSPIWLFFREPTKEFKANSHLKKCH